MDDKYKAFRNLMFNELAITRKDIEQWTREAVNQRVDAVVKHIISTDLIQGSIDRAVAKNAHEIFNGYQSKSMIVEAISKSIKDRLIIEMAP
jgi:hypothetical protein